VSERFTAAAEWKSVGNAGELDGYMSVFNVLDQGGDVVVPGAFRKTFDGWNRAKSPMPLISDHEISTSGVIGSVVHLAEDDYGARIRARFSGIAKAQNVRQLMLEKHLSGMSFTYSPIRFHHGTFGGEPARYLDEVRVFEASVVALPMNELALASAKAGPGVDVHADVEAQLVELEQWAAAATATSALRDIVAHPDAAAHAIGVMQETRLRQDLARLEAWAASLPPASSDSERAAARRQADWDRRNDYTSGLARTMERLEATKCQHSGCPAGRCWYR
jgi:HK97 family phage prohead protease